MKMCRFGMRICMAFSLYVGCSCLVVTLGWVHSNLMLEKFLAPLFWKYHAHTLEGRDPLFYNQSIQFLNIVMYYDFYV